VTLLLSVWAALILAGAIVGHGWAETFALAVDLFTFSIFRRQFGVTISSWCGWQLRDGGAGNKFGRFLGTVLNHLQPGHCEGAIANDKTRAQAALFFLNYGHF
jgi:hypothetical protein